MKRFITTLTGIAALVLLTTSIEAQDKDKADKDKSKNKNEEIIIRRKTDKDAKVTIEIKDDEVLVNGKPADEYEDENISVRKRHRVPDVTPHTIFRSQGGAWSLGDNADLFNNNIAFLGVESGENEKGAEIKRVTDESAADEAGLEKGDIITKVDDNVIDKPEDLTRAIRKHQPGEKATITYLRNGKEQKATATLGKRNGMTLNGMVNPRVDIPNFNFNWDNGGFGQSYSYSFGRPRLGVKAQDTEDGKGVKVLDIDDESAAEKAGLKKDDIITEFDGKTVNDTDALARAARDAREKSSVTVKILRDGKSQTIEIKTPRKLKTTNL